MNIGILGGSFNPPHIGHLLVAQQVLDFTNLEEIWWLPAYRHTFDKPLASVAHRLAMTRLLNLPKTKVSTLEIDHQLDGNTITLIPLLHKHYPKHKFTFIVGTDQLPTFTKWGRWQELLQELPFLVVPRAGFPAQPLYDGMRLLVHSQLIVTNISSTKIRERIKKKLSIDNFVPEEITAYISTHQLYG